MSYQPSQRIRAELNIEELNKDEKGRDELLGAILAMAPNSPLYAKNPALQAAVVKLGASFTTYKAADVTAAQSRAQANHDESVARQAREDNNRALILLRGIVEHDATTVEDVQSVALPVRIGKPPTPPLIPPASIDTRLGKPGSGGARVSAHELGGQKGRFAAEASPNPVIPGGPGVPTSWASLPGTGKSRDLSGQPGTQLWVRFALVRGKKQSAWSTPILVTLP